MTLAASLMSPREVVRWLHGSIVTPETDSIIDRLQQNIGAILDASLVDEIDEACGETLIRGEERVLFLVGTLLMHNDQRLLWSTIYNAFVGIDATGVDDNGHEDEDEVQFLERVTAKARAGTF